MSVRTASMHSAHNDTASLDLASLRTVRRAHTGKNFPASSLPSPVHCFSFTSSNVFFKLMCTRWCFANVCRLLVFASPPQQPHQRAGIKATTAIPLEVWLWVKKRLGQAIALCFQLCFNTADWVTRRTSGPLEWQLGLVVARWS